MPLLEEGGEGDFLLSKSPGGGGEKRACFAKGVLTAPIRNRRKKGRGQKDLLVILSKQKEKKRGGKMGINSKGKSGKCDPQVKGARKGKGGERPCRTLTRRQERKKRKTPPETQKKGEGAQDQFLSSEGDTKEGKKYLSGTGREWEPQAGQDGERSTAQPPKEEGGKKRGFVETIPKGGKKDITEKGQVP